MEFWNMGWPVRSALAVVLMFGCSLAWNEEYYIGAVYEHNRQDQIKGDPAAEIKANLEYYKRATREAKRQGADIIVFPEYGLFRPSSTRNETKKNLEFVPNPEEGVVIPCNEAKPFAHGQIVRTLSCMAKENAIYVVANMGGIEKCESETDCPEDGDLHFNTNVVFDRKGMILVRYYKEHLFFETAMDLPRVEQNPIFVTEFGKFATFICFDIIFEKMTKTSHLQDIDAVFFSTLWINIAPNYMPTQWWQAWAVGNNATIFASNLQIPGYLLTGSGIFRGKTDSAAQTLNPDGISKLIVAKIPRRRTEPISSAKITAITKNSMKEWKDDGKDVPEVCSYVVLGKAKNISKDYRCKNDDVQNYTLVKLQKNEDHLKVCSNGMCCELDYEANDMSESYYFGVNNGTYTIFNRYFWWEENCFLARCDDVNGTACSNFLMISHNTLFHRISMTANFTTDHIFPSFVSNRMRLVPVENWTFDKRPDHTTVTMKSHSGIPVIVATLKGRVYDRDPPYVR